GDLDVGAGPAEVAPREGERELEVVYLGIRRLRGRCGGNRECGRGGRRDGNQDVQASPAHGYLQSRGWRPRGAGSSAGTIVLSQSSLNERLKTLNACWKGRPNGLIPLRTGAVFQ